MSVLATEVRRAATEGQRFGDGRAYRHGNGTRQDIPLRSMMSALDKWNILNEREQKIAILFVLRDLQVKEIAAKLSISQTSVKHALAIVYRIVGVTGAIRFALWLGLHIKVIDPEYKEDSL